MPDIERCAARVATLVEAVGGHPSGLQIVAWARAHPAGRVSGKGMAEALDTPLSRISYHVRKLHEIGVLRGVGEKRVRGATQHLYVLSARGLRVADDLEALANREDR